MTKADMHPTDDGIYMGFFYSEAMGPLNTNLSASKPVLKNSFYISIIV